MRDKLGNLGRKLEIIRRVVPPIVQRAQTREAIKRGVEFECIEVTRVKIKPLARRKSGWKKGVLPFLVMITGAADEPLYLHDSLLKIKVPTATSTTAAFEMYRD